MQVSLAVEPDDDRDYFMAIATREEWEEIMRNIDGIGHSPALLKLKEELKGWGVTK